MAYSGIETTLYATIVADATINAVIAGRCFPVIKPEAHGVPCIVYTRTGTDRDASNVGHTGYALASLDIECMAPTFYGAKELAKLVRVLLLGAKGAYGDHTVAGFHCVNESDTFYTDIIYNGKPGVFSTTLEYAVEYTEDIGTITPS